MAGSGVPDLARPVFLRPLYLAVVVAGGAVGTAARHLLESMFAPAPGAWPWVTFVINVTGAFLLGALLTGLGRRGPDVGARRYLRVAVGTGVFGGFTTYSTFTLEVHALIGGGQSWFAAGYALASVATGMLAALLGLLLARWLVPSRGGQVAP